MAKTKQPSDVNVTAFQILEALTGEQPCHASPIPTAKELAKKKPSTKKVPPEKNPAAVALGRLGGLKGGKARMAKLSATRRSAISKKAAKVRWEASRKQA